MIKSYRTSIVIAAVVIVVAAVCFFFLTYGEFEKPSIQFTQDVSTIGQQKVIEVALSDAGSGLKSMSLSIRSAPSPLV